MLVHTERTPNPRAMKFLPGVPLTDRPEGYGAEHAGLHPFLGEVFSLGGVEGVFVGRDFVTVTLARSSWDADARSLREKAAEALARHAATLAGIEGPSPAAVAGATGDTAARIASVIETRVRPAVAHDGGDITFRSYEDGVLVVDMKGACAGCPSAAATVRHGIANLMRHLFPEVREVKAA